MTLTTSTPATVTCNVCGKTWNGDDGPYLWDSLEDARSVATEENWFIRSDGYAICPDPFGYKHTHAGHALLDGHNGGLTDSERDDLLAVRRWLEPGYYDEDDPATVNVEVASPDGTRYYAGIRKIHASGSDIPADEANLQPGELLVGPGTEIRFLTDQEIDEIAHGANEAAVAAKEA